MATVKGDKMEYDAAIIGAGPAGLAAALDCAYLKMKTIVIEAENAGGALVQSYPWKRVDSFLGFREMNGSEVARRLVDHVRKEGVEIREKEEAVSVSPGKIFEVKTNRSSYKSKSVIVCTGLRGTPRKLGVEGEELEGVEYSLTDPKKFSGREVLVVGGGDSAVDSAMGLEKAGAVVWLAHRKNDLRAIDESKEKVKKSSVNILWNNEVSRFRGSGRLQSAEVFDNKTGEKKTIKTDHAFICIGNTSSRECLEKVGIKMKGACAETDKNGMTSVPGLFAAGDIASEIKRIPQALATGERAAFSAYKFVKNPYWK